MPEDPVTLRDLIRTRPVPAGLSEDAVVAGFIEQFQHRFGEHLEAVLMYGSYLRGKRDTVLDFYVFLSPLYPALPRLHALGNRLLPPNVYTDVWHPPQGGSDAQVRCKYATLSPAQFMRGMQTRFDSYFWARFTQPSAWVYGKQEALTYLDGTLAEAVRRFVAETLPLLPAQFSAAELWTTGLHSTYGSELRAEREGAAHDLYESNATYFDALIAACAAEGGPNLTRTETGYRQDNPARAWHAGVRRYSGKLLSFARIVKAGLTFNDGLNYLLWKIERHSGIYIEPTPRQQRYPLIFAWGLLWRLYRRGAFS